MELKRTFSFTVIRRRALVVAGAAGASSMASVIAATTLATSTAPSPPLASMEVSSARTVSTICSRTLVRAGVRASSPSRIRRSSSS